MPPTLPIERRSARGSAAVEEEIELGALEMRVSEGADSAPGAAARWVPLLGPATAGCQCELLVLATLAPRGRGAPTGEAAPDYPDASALLTMREGFEGEMTATNIEIGVIGADKKFRVLPAAAVADYLAEAE